jgi:hypothetical protein
MIFLYNTWHLKLVILLRSDFKYINTEIKTIRFQLLNALADA